MLSYNIKRMESVDVIVANAQRTQQMAWAML
jgi:hypothetical protein